MPELRSLLQTWKLPYKTQSMAPVFWWALGVAIHPLLVVKREMQLCSSHLAAVRR